MRNLKKRVTTLLLAGVMMAASFVPAYAGEREVDMIVNGRVVKCFSSCTSTGGTAETYIAIDEYYTSSSVYAGLTLYTLDWQDGSIDKYMSDTWDSFDWAEASVTIKMSDRDRHEGYYVSSVHTASVDGVAADKDTHLIVYKDSES